MNPEVTRALEIAQRRYGKNLEGALPQGTQQQLSDADKATMAKATSAFKHPRIHPRQAFARGVVAKRQRWYRVTPYYEMPQADHFWFAGFDGKTMEEAIATQ